MALWDAYLPIGLFVIIAVSMPVVTFFLNRLFRPHRPARNSFTTYECGETPIGDAQIQFHFQYYLFAIIFLVFDVVAVFIFLWALGYDGFSVGGKVSSIPFLFAFLALMTVVVLYALRKEEVIWI